MRASHKRMIDIIGLNFYNMFVEKYGKVSDKQFNAVIDIYLTNAANEEIVLELYSEYISLNSSSYRAVEIRRGTEAGAALKNKLVSRKPISRKGQNIYCPEFVSKTENISIADAEKVIEERRLRVSASMKEAHKRNPKTRDSNPLCIEYYIKRNYADPDAALAEYKSEKLMNSRDSYIRKYGSEHKFVRRMKKRNETMLSRYGTTVASSGRVSKESLLFFDMLFARIAEMGVSREDVLYGNKEFASNDNGKNYFYDFTIRTLKYMVEYNGSFWHPNPSLAEWRGFGDRDELILKYNDKISHIESRGYTCKIVWDTDNLEDKISEIVEEVKEKLDEYRQNK